MIAVLAVCLISPLDVLIAGAITIFLCGGECKGVLVVIFRWLVDLWIGPFGLDLGCMSN